MHHYLLTESHCKPSVLCGYTPSVWAGVYGAGLFASADLQKSERSAGFHLMPASDWAVVKISTLPFSVTRSRGGYLRVVGIIEMVE